MSDEVVQGAPEATDVVDVLVTDPVVDAPVTEPEGETAAETSVDWGTRVTEWGGEDSISEAIDFVRSMQTVDGVKFFLSEGAKALRDLGIPADDLAALIAAEEAAADQAVSLDIDPDAPLTMAQYRELERQREAAAAKERSEADFRASVASNVKAGLEALGVTDQKVGQIITQYADEYVTPADYGDPAKIAAALKRGHADFQATVKQQYDDYLQSKVTDGASSPTPLVGGQSPGGTDLPEPQSLDEAIARRRAMWKDQGFK